MGIRSEWVRYGAAASDRLAALVAELQGGDPLAPVTVILPTNPVGVTVRRALGSRPGGVANVTFTTIDQLAHDLAAAGLEAHGRHLLTDQVRAAAVRLALRADPRSFAGVADHPSTDRSIAEALAQIRRAGPAAEQALGVDPRRVVADVLAIGRHAAGVLADHYDEVDLATVARSLVAPAGAMVLYLPTWLAPAQRALVASAAEHGEVVVLAGAVGDEAAESSVVDLCRRLGAPLPPPGHVSPPPLPSEVRSVSDADDEARHAVRWLLARRAAGVPFERMAVLYTAAEPYRRSLHRHLESAGIPNNGPAVGTVAETVAGRFVGSLLSLAAGGFRRSDVVALVASGPIVSPDGSVVRSTLWDRATRSAGVVRGLDQWRGRMSARIDDLLDGDPAPDSWRRVEASVCHDVLGFVEGLAIDIAALDAVATWSEFSAWLLDVLQRYLPSAGGRTGWPEAEREAAERFELTIALLAGLDAVEPNPTAQAREAAVEVEVDRPTRRVGRLADGVLVGPLSAGVGADLDAIVVVGVVEGLAPRPVRHGVILGGREHAVVGPDLEGDSVEAQHGRYLAALAAAPAGQRLVTFPRGDLRSGRNSFRSRWLGPVPVVEVPSAAAAWQADASEPAASMAEYQLRVLADAVDEASLAATPLVAAVPALGAGVQAVAARRWGGLTPWSGLVSGARAAPLLGRELSVTSIERYARCPFSFFLHDVLGVRDVERPEERDDVDPRDRGIVIHQVLEQLVSERIAAAGAGQVVSDADEERRFEELLTEQLDHLEAIGAAGRPVRWELERAALAVQAASFFDLDRALRATGARAESTELHFGGQAGAPVVVEVGDGDGGLRSLRFRGSADRVDRRPDGGAVVIDYKTVNEAKRPEDIRRDLLQGRLLQLPLYARAVADADAPAPHAAYWYLPRRKGPAAVTVELAEIDEWFTDAIEVHSQAIAAGVFPAVPGEVKTWPRPTFDHCAWCSFDDVCHSERDEMWSRAEGQPEVERFVDLLRREPPAPSEVPDPGDAP